MKRIQLQTPLGVRLGLGIQTRCKAPTDLHMGVDDSMHWLKLGKWGCPLDSDPKLAMWQPSSRLKKTFSTTEISANFFKWWRKFVRGRGIVGQDLLSENKTYGIVFPIQWSWVQIHWVTPRSTQSFILPRSIKWVPGYFGNLVLKSKLSPHKKV